MYETIIQKDKKNSKYKNCYFRSQQTAREIVIKCFMYIYISVCLLSHREINSIFFSKNEMFLRVLSLFKYENAR